MLLYDFDSKLRQPMSQSVLINLFKMPAAKELMNFKARLSNYVTEFIDIGGILNFWISGPEHLFDQGASMIPFFHSFVLFVPFCG